MAEIAKADSQLAENEVRLLRRTLDLLGISPVDVVKPAKDSSSLPPQTVAAGDRTPQAAASESSTATGTWSDGFSQARTCLSIDVPASRFAASGDSSRWSMRMPLSFCQAPA